MSRPPGAIGVSSRPQWPAPAGVRAAFTLRSRRGQCGALRHAQRRRARRGLPRQRWARTAARVRAALACRRSRLARAGARHAGARDRRPRAPTPRAARRCGDRARSAGVVAVDPGGRLPAGAARRARRLGASPRPTRAGAGSPPGCSEATRRAARARAVASARLARARDRAAALRGGRRRCATPSSRRTRAPRPPFAPNARGRWQCDLPALARQRLQQAGVRQVFGGSGARTPIARASFPTAATGSADAWRRSSGCDVRR